MSTKRTTSAGNHDRGRRSTYTTWRSSDESLEAKIGKLIRPMPNGCWEWQASTATGGYGQSKTLTGQPVRVHRYVYETLVGPIPERHHLHHECENTRCCNPAHLTPMPAGDHIAHHAALRRKASERV